MKKLILIIALLCISTSALAVEPIDWSRTKTYALSTAIQAAVGAGGAAALSCNTTTPTFANTTQNDGLAISNASKICQKLKITSTVQVCQVKLFVVTAGTYTVEFWTDDMRAGTKIGGTSSTQNYGTGFNVVFTWSSDYPQLTSTGDVYLHIIKMEAGGGDLGVASGPDYYENTDFDLHTGGVDGNTEMTFAVYTLQ
jgi:hypothetical protein